MPPPRVQHSTGHPPVPQATDSKPQWLIQWVKMETQRPHTSVEGPGITLSAGRVCFTQHASQPGKRFYLRMIITVTHRILHLISYVITRNHRL